MKIRHCEFEGEVLRAVQSGQATDDLQAHIDRCETCREAQLVAVFFDALPEAQWADVPLPSPESIWWRGQIARKRDLAARSVASINLVQKFACVLAVVVAVVPAALWSPQLLQNFPYAAYLSAATVLFLAGSVLVLYAWATERI